MQNLIIYEKPDVKNATMLLSFSGWMDGGSVSTGTVEYLKNKLKAKKFAEIDPQNFYIFNLPGTMQQVAEFRPHTRIQNGIVVDFGYTQNEFFCDEKNNLIFFQGKEPNLRWSEYSNCIWEIAKRFDVRAMYFVGSVAGLIPHTREVRVSCSFSSQKQKEALKEYDVRFTNYEGPASIVTLLTKLSRQKGMEMISFVAEIPIYVQTENPKGIKVMIKRLVKLIGIDIDLDELSQRSDEFETNINELVAKQPKLAEQIRKLEENYDKEFFDQREGDFEEWLKRHGIDKL
ncbi:PAC2 family protein [Candidatus Aerophobetes bacterium]|nr:PAC2 family protein [Candidatus Aerophobetes bacterium]